MKIISFFFICAMIFLSTVFFKENLEINHLYVYIPSFLIGYFIVEAIYDFFCFNTSGQKCESTHNLKAGTVSFLIIAQGVLFLLIFSLNNNLNYPFFKLENYILVFYILNPLVLFRILFIFLFKNLIK